MMINVQIIMEDAAFRQGIEMVINTLRGIVNIPRIYRNYATLISHGKPRKVSWRRLNVEQRTRALELAGVYGW